VNRQSVADRRDRTREARAAVAQQVATQRPLHLTPVQLRVLVRSLHIVVHRPLITIEPSKATAQKSPQREIHIISVTEETSKRRSRVSPFQTPSTSQPALLPRYHPPVVSAAPTPSYTRKTTVRSPSVSKTFPFDPPTRHSKMVSSTSTKSTAK
jgi:hypothetical protein